MSSALTTNEVTLLSSYERTIEKGLSTFHEVGSALLQIRDSRLYRDDFKTFEEYCKGKWKLTRQYVNNVIAAAETVDKIGNNCFQKPATESQARPLTSVPKESRAEAWQHAVDTAPLDEDKQPVITAKHVEKAVKEWKQEKEPTPAKAEGPQVPDTSAFDELNDAIKSLVADASALCKSDAGKFLNIKLVRSLASDIKKLLKEARPTAICPYCGGRKCSICARTGAVPREVVSHYVPEGK